MKTKFLRWLGLLLSVTLNIFFILLILVGSLNRPTYELGILSEDVYVGTFGNSDVIFKLPKGLTVRNESPRFIAAAGQFERHRFATTVSGVNDEVEYGKSNHSFGSLYSISSDNKIYRNCDVTSQS